MDQTWSIDLKEMAWEVRPRLYKARFKHSCGVLKVGSSEKVVVVAGGTGDRDSDITDTVETLHAIVVPEDNINFDQQWRSGPKLPIPLSNSASAVTSDEHVLYIFGGKMISGDYSSYVFKLSCSGICNPDLQLDHCSWSKAEYELKTPSSLGLALIMPRIPMVNREFANSTECFSPGKFDEY